MALVSIILFSFADWFDDGECQVPTEDVTTIWVCDLEIYM
jgi:hypothetical protein